MPAPCSDPDVRAAVWREYKRACARLGLDYREETLPRVIQILVEQAAVLADEQCVRIIAALQAAQGRERDALVPLDDGWLQTVSLR